MTYILSTCRRSWLPDLGNSLLVVLCILCRLLLVSDTSIPPAIHLIRYKITDKKNHHTKMSQVDVQLKDVTILGAIPNDARKILTKEACAFLAILHRTFNPTRKALLQRRIDRQAEIDKGHLPDFLPETKHIRENDAWKGAPPAPGLVDRRVEITGPTDRKMVVNALNSDVWTYMADFEGTPRFPCDWRISVSILTTR